MTEPNRLRAECRYYESATGETGKAYLAALQAVQAFPRDAVAHTNLASYLAKLGQPNRAADEAREAARLLPSPYTYYDLVLRSINADRLNEAKAAFDDADARSFDSTDLRVHRALLAFLQHDKAAMEEQWSWAVGKPDADRFLVGRAAVECYYGHFSNSRLLCQQAIDMATKAGTIPWYGTYWSMVEAEVGNLERARSLAAQALKSLQKRHDQIYLALALARVGNVEEAQKLADALDQEYPLDTAIQYYYLPTIRAAIKLIEKDPASAVEILRPAVKYDLAYPDSFQSLYPAYIRGLAYLQMGDGPQAAAEFQKLLDHPGLVGRDVHGALSHLQLARAQRLMGDEAASRRSYEDFLTLWKDADPDIPIYQQAKAEYAKLTRP
jgi:tetratricopeptide (TPR) repeat protein